MNNDKIMKIYRNVREVINKFSQLYLKMHRQCIENCLEIFLFIVIIRSIILFFFIYFLSDYEMIA